MAFALKFAHFVLLRAAVHSSDTQRDTAPRDTDTAKDGTKQIEPQTASC